MFPPGIPPSKRLFDLILTTIGLVLISPFLAVLAVLVRTYLGRPVLFRQLRPGYGGKLFAIIKFRTMTDQRDAQGQLLPDGQRLTGLGRTLRAFSLDELPDLVAVLNSLSAGVASPLRLAPREEFNLRRYEAHVQAHLRTIPIMFDEVPPLSENTLYDRVWRFIAILFLAQAGAIRVWQEGPTIWVMTYEVDRERQAIPGDVEDPHGVEGVVG